MKGWALGLGLLFVVTAAPEAPAATLKGLQFGTVTIAAGSTSATATLSPAIDTTKSFLLFGVSESTNNPSDGQVSGQITNTTTVTFARATTGVAVTVKWYVVEFTSGVTVQRGAADMSVTVPLNVTLATPVNLAQSFPLLSYRINGTNYDQNDFIKAKLTSTTNLELDAPCTCAVSPQVIEWQVVEYTGASVRTNDVTFSGTSVTVPLAPAVNPASTLLLYSYFTDAGGPAIGDRLIRGLITGGGTDLTFDRGSTGAGTTVTLTWYLIEFTDGTTVQQANEPFSSAQSLKNVTISSVNLGSSVALAGGNYVRGGRTPYVGDDVPGMAWFTFDLTTPTNLRITRGATTAAADVGWSVVSFGLATAVELMRFEAVGGDGAVDLSWQTGSELNNLGFNLYRSSSEAGPYARITSAVIPGRGASVEGASYRYVDGGLTNGATYFYRLEDIDTSGVTTLHGPVSATPQIPSPGGGGAGSSGGGSATKVVYGDPSSVSLRILERSQRHALLELRTGGFYASRQTDGSVVLEVPGMEEILDPGRPALPVRRAFVEAVATRKVRLATVVSSDVLSFADLVPALSGSPEMVQSREGVVRARIRRAGVARPLGGGLFPVRAARLAGTVFQGELKKALVELWPLRWDPATRRLELARRLVVRVEFAGNEETESPRGAPGRGRRLPPWLGRSADGLLAQLAVRQRGVYAVGFEDLFRRGHRSLPASDLRLSRQGQAVGFHIEPAGSSFVPGSVLYFFTEGSSLNPYGNEAVYELSLDRNGGLMMPLVSASPSGSAVPFAWGLGRWEENLTFQPGLLDAPDLWLWESLIAPVKKSHHFALGSLGAASEASQLTVFLQGGSDEDGVDDHHVRVWVNGTPVGEAVWDGKTSNAVSASIAPGLLHEGDNLLEVESLGDAGASYSLVFLDRFELVHPRALSATAGSFEAGFSLSGSTQVSGLGPDSLLLDVTSSTEPQWLFGASPTPGGIAFRTEAGRQRLAVSAQSVLHPEVRPLLPSSLRRTRNRADYLLIGPGAFLPAAQPLLDLRQRQGLGVQAVAVEEVYQEFGHGEATPQAIRDFIAYAYHHWQSPSPRYVLLLGDASYDYKNFLHSGASNAVPPLLVKTSFLWTASDQAYAAVNGEDLMPDLALGRLPAATLEEAHTLVDKVVAFEAAGLTLTRGPAVLVADNPDLGGDFEASAQAVAPLLASSHPVETIFLSENGSATRPAIAAAFDRGAALMSYLGHGGIAVWASENVFNNQDVATLGPQPQQPLLLTMDCLNGYFHFPFLNSLAEELLKAPGKGSIASFAPSGLSLHAPADLFHKALIQEIASGSHERLGDAVFAAQADFAQTGAFPELLSIYNLLGDPALRIR